MLNLKTLFPFCVTFHLPIIRSMFSKKIVLIIVILCLTTTLFSQTKPVAFRSHSGNMNYFSMAEPDNLGWGGTPNQINWSDTMAIFATPIPIDTATNKPYCNNPNIPKDSLESNFPFYTTVVNGDSSKAAPLDTFAKPKEHLKSRHEVEKNNNLPIGDIGDVNTNTPSPNFNFILVLFLIMLGVGILIWMTNRKKIIQSA